MRSENSTGHVLVILAHPCPESFCHAVSETAVTALRAAGRSVDLLDLYHEGFEPRLGGEEKRLYTNGLPLDASARDLVARLKEADGLVVVFPTWWSGLPAILKGYFDRIFVPGVAFDVNNANGKLVPLLGKLDFVLVITTTGAPWWHVRLFMGNPVARMLKRGLFATCAPQARFRILQMHAVESSTQKSRSDFLSRIRNALQKI